MEQNDTIVAVATPPGCSGIAIVRMSGDGTAEITKKVFRDAKKHTVKEMPSHKMMYGFIVNPENGEVIDEVLTVFMKAPRTYTREDVAEINCHGGMYTVSRILEVLVKNGARTAEPGEFTKRAFMSGRLDLAQAEAVIDLINARTEASARNSINQLQGRLSEQMKDMRKKLIGLLAEIEASIDFPEYDIEHISREKAGKELIQTEKELEKLLENAKKGRILKEGIGTAIVGTPNVGKSSLLNELIGEEKAIVTEIPGTTRDIIEDYVDLDGIPLRVYDTAGIRDTEDAVEKIGVERAEAILERAELILLVLDGSRKLKPADRKVIEKIKNRNVIVLINKSDLGLELGENEVQSLLPDKKVLVVSVKEKKGLDELEAEIRRMFFGGQINADDGMMVTNIRQKELISKARDCVGEANNAVEKGMPLDCVAIDIRSAADYLGQITGETVAEDVINEIFSRFCIGK